LDLSSSDLERITDDMVISTIGSCIDNDILFLLQPPSFDRPEASVPACSVFFFFFFFFNCVVSAATAFFGPQRRRFNNIQQLSLQQS